MGNSSRKYSSRCCASLQRVQKHQHSHGRSRHWSMHPGTCSAIATKIENAYSSPSSWHKLLTTQNSNPLAEPKIRTFQFLEIVVRLVMTTARCRFPTKVACKKRTKNTSPSNEMELKELLLLESKKWGRVQIFSLKWQRSTVASQPWHALKDLVSTFLPPF